MQNNSLSPSAVRVMTEDELVEMRPERRWSGPRVVRSGGHWWVDNRGFCRRVHFAATVPAAEVRRPTAYCWAYHTLLPAEDAEAANVWSPLHLVEDLANYGEHSLDSTQRKHVRRCRRAFELVQLTDAGMLAEQGWPIYSANARRLGLPLELDEEAFRAQAAAWAEDDRRLIVGALQDGRLVGYLETRAIGHTAYLDEIRLSETALKANLSAYLHYEAAQLYRQSGLVQEVCAGLPLPQRPGVIEFKRRMGMPIVHRPARFWSPAPIARLFHLAKPAVYYRATGIPPRNMKPPGDPATAPSRSPYHSPRPVRGRTRSGVASGTSS